MLATYSYLEFYLTQLAWIINNGIWYALAGTGLVAWPFIAIILQEWLRARGEGADEGNKGILSIFRVENRIYAFARKRLIHSEIRRRRIYRVFQRIFASASA